MTPLEEAQARNQDLRDQLEHQWTFLRTMGNYINLDGVNLYLTQQRLEHLIDFLFEELSTVTSYDRDEIEPSTTTEGVVGEETEQYEVSREAFELDWEGTLSEILKDYLKDANRVQLLRPIDTTGTETPGKAS